MIGFVEQIRKSSDFLKAKRKSREKVANYFTNPPNACVKLNLVSLPKRKIKTFDLGQRVVNVETSKLNPKFTIYFIIHNVKPSLNVIT